MITSKKYGMERKKKKKKTKKQKSIILKWGKLPNNISAKGLMPTIVNWVGNLCP